MNKSSQEYVTQAYKMYLTLILVTNGYVKVNDNKLDFGCNKNLFVHKKYIR